MPSLAQLEEFKSSFKNVANEAQIMSKNRLPMENVGLPENEPPAPYPENIDVGSDLVSDTSFLNVNDLGLDLPPESFSGTADSDAGFDLGDLLGNGLADLGLDIQGSEPPLGAPDILSGFSDDLETISLDTDGFPFNGSTPEPSAGPDRDEKSPPDDFTAGETETPETETPEFEAEEPVFSPAEAEPPETSEPGDSAELSGGEDAPLDFSDIEFPDIDLTNALDMGGEIEAAGFEAEEPVFSPAEAEPPETLEPDDSAELPDGEDSSLDFSDTDSSGTDSSDIEFPDIDLTNALDMGGEFDEKFNGFGADMEGEVPSDSPDSGYLDDGTEDFGTDVYGNEEFSGDPGGETEFETEETALELESSFDDFTELPIADESKEENADPFEDFSAGDDWEIPSIPQKTPDTPETPVDDFGDFSLPGFDDAAGKPGKAGAKFTPRASEEIEEINLNDNEYRQLQDTLSNYPLNLRIACEELIAEQVVAPDQMSELVKLLVRGAPAKETAALAGKILNRSIPIPRAYAKQTGAELEAEQASFGYIFVHRLLPVLRFAGLIVLVAASLGYLVLRFVVIPMQAERLYKEGYALIQSGEYVQANELFRRGFERRRVKKWFYRYAEAFRDERQYIYAQRKYDELLRVYPRDKKGALDYAAMETHILKNFEKADRILRNNILDYAVNDREGLLALAENNLAWGEIEHSRYEDARAAYARLIERYGRKDPYLEGMLKYFIRTDKLNEVLPLQAHFMSSQKRKITVPTLAELGGYLLDKRFEETEGVPEEHAAYIEGIRDVLIRAITGDRTYPESYYHLARYYNYYRSVSEERQSLRDALRIFAASPEESPRRVGYHIDALRRYAEVLINAGEFFPAEEELIRGVRLYEDARARQVIRTSRPEFGRLYANLGDLEFFAKSGDMEAALRFYQEAERNGWAPPEIQYRMGAAHYQNEQWEDALQRFVVLTAVMPNNKRLLYALGNTSYLRGNYFAAQAYYNRLMNLLDAERIYFPNLVPGSRQEAQDLMERMMVAENNMGVTLEVLTRITGDISYRTRALYLFSESIRTWDVLTRDPASMARMRPLGDLYGPGINLPYLNTQSILHPSPAYEQQIFMRIDRDSLEPSPWELLIPRDYQLSDQLLPVQFE